MYSDSAAVYDALFRHKDYAKACLTLRSIVQRIAPHARTLLDVGCGTGQHLYHLRDYFRVEGLDASRAMLDIARRRCVGVPLHHGTLVDFRLDARFDVVTCLFGTIGYCVTVENLHQALRCMVKHLQPHGVMLIEPWVSPDRFVSGRLVFDSVDDPDLKVARIYRTQRSGRVSIFDSAYIVGTEQGVAQFSERQELGLFTYEEYLSAFRVAGLQLSEGGDQLFGYGLYVGTAAGDPSSADAKG